jgi:2Fe-2S ferredoxin
MTFIDFSGVQREIMAPSGTSVMRAALDNQIRGIDGDCGGQCGCGTCHVFVDPAWLVKLGDRSDAEAGMLELAADAQTNSRLGCQITLRAELDGLVVHVPKAQH